ncbi:MAG: AAA-like domain-containing protein [Rivularia sp. (in: cyanobacteria)]
MSSIEEVIKIAEELICNKTGKSLSFIQKVILEESLNQTDKTYAQIAQENNYSESYIKQLVAPKLWKMVSATVDEKVNKTNCCAVLKQQLKNSSNSNCIEKSNLIETSPKIALEFPEGQVPLSSPFYIQRDIEKTCYQEILQPGALIRIKAPRQMGKSSLLSRILAYGNSQNYQTVCLSLDNAETKIFSSSEKLLRWMCSNITYQLGIKSKLEEYWDEDMGALVNCTIYFRNYLLKQISHPAILAFDEINQLFEYPNIARDFLALLRSWHEEAKNVNVWENLRLIIANSTDVYIPLPINSSPFNIGLAIELSPFTTFQVEDLAQRHGIKVSTTELEQLMEITGGFPYLVRLAFYHSAHSQIPLKELMENAATNTSIFNKHLHQQLWHLQHNPDLANGFQKVIKETTPIDLEQEVAFKLKSLGLVHLQGNFATVSCRLYREYFGECSFNEKKAIAFI